MNKKAIIIGATGLVGSHILTEVLSDTYYSSVVIIVRKTTGIQHPKLQEVIHPLTDLSSLSSYLKGDVLFNALGTTLSKAGSKKEQQRIDRDLPISFAHLCSTNGVSLCLNVSSVGANAKGNFYLRTKAEMEIGVKASFEGRVFFFRPSLLLGDRPSIRWAEQIAAFVMKGLNPFLIGDMSRYRSISAHRLAKAMVEVSKYPDKSPEVLYYKDMGAF